ncbi:MAG: hypothetical protein AB4041_20920 [Microcystaceae cyanobacterium]
MDPHILVIFKSDIQAQLNLVKRIDEQLNQRAEGLTSDDLIRLESVAYQMHNLYNATEELFKIIATYFENNIADTAKWHSLLLQRMSQKIEGVRPAVLSEETYLLLNSLRGFRHFFRHAYGTPLEYELLKPNLTKAIRLFSCLEADINQFMRQLSPS